MIIFRALLRYSVLLILLVNVVVLAQPIGNGISLSAQTTPENQINLAWITLSDEVVKNWVARIDNNNPTQMYIESHPRPTNEQLLKKILVLIPKKSKSYVLAINTLLKVLEEHEIYAKLTLYHFNKNPQHAYAAVALAEAQAMDLIFAVGSISVDFVHENYHNGSIPVVTSTNKDPVMLGQLTDYDHGSGTNIAYTSLNVPVNIQMQYLFDLKPQLRTVGLMYNRANKQTVATEVVPIREVMIKQGLIPIDVPVESAATAVQDLQSQIPLAMQTMRKHDAELNNSLFWITGSTAVFTQIKLINQLTANLPVLGSISNVVTEGDDSAVMAIGVDRRNNALLAGLYAVAILTGNAQPGDLKLGIVTPPDLAIHFGIARKIGLKIPLHFFESAAFIYDYEGKAARAFGQSVIVR